MLGSKCPKCESLMLGLTVNAIDGRVPFGAEWKCITLCCPHCGTVLGAQIDPIAIKTDIVNAIKKG